MECRSVPEGVCFLCRQRGDLEDSHIAPRFVGEWMKKTGTGYLRNVITPNLRQQSLPHWPMLCGICEDRFSLRETFFASQVFYPAVDSCKSEVAYDDSFYYFAISFLWRSMVDGAVNEPEDSTRPYTETLDRAEKKWRRFLLGTSKQTFPGEVRALLISSEIRSSSVDLKGVGFYLVRAVDYTILTPPGRCLMYAKLPGLCFFAPLVPETMDVSCGSPVNPGGGRLIVGAHGVHDPEIGRFLVDRANELQHRYSAGLSDKQHDKITKEHAARSDEIAASLYGQAIRNDAIPRSRMQSNAPRTRKIGRNQPCPCGSGKKYKKCHGERR